MSGPRERGAGAMETMAAVLLGMGVFAVMMGIYLGVLPTAQEGVLRAQLRSLRTQVRLFSAVTGHNPADLRELLAHPYSLFPLGAQGLEVEPASRLLKADAVRAAAADTQGYPLDPWKRRYAYDPSTGRVWSTRAGQEDR